MRRALRPPTPAPRAPAADPAAGVPLREQSQRFRDLASAAVGKVRAERRRGGRVEPSSILPHRPHKPLAAAAVAVVLFSSSSSLDQQGRKVWLGVRGEASATRQGLQPASVLLLLFLLLLLLLRGEGLFFFSAPSSFLAPAPPPSSLPSSPSRRPDPRDAAPLLVPEGVAPDPEPADHRRPGALEGEHRGVEEAEEVEAEAARRRGRRRGRTFVVVVVVVVARCFRRRRRRESAVEDP